MRIIVTIPDTLAASRQVGNLRHFLRFFVCFELLSFIQLLDKTAPILNYISTFFVTLWILDVEYYFYRHGNTAAETFDLFPRVFIMMRQEYTRHKLGT